MLASPPAARSLASQVAIGGGRVRPVFYQGEYAQNPVTLGSGAVAATPAMVSQVRCTGARVGSGWKLDVLCACAGAGEKAGAGAAGNVISCFSLVLAVPYWRACVSV